MSAGRPRSQKAGRIVFDVETVAPIDEPWWSKISAEAIERRSGLPRDASERERFEWAQMWGATHTVFAHVIAAGMLHKPTGRKKAFANPSEVLVLEGIRDALAQIGAIVTFGGHEFDVPLLVNRFVHHRLEVPSVLARAIEQKPWHRRPHLDLRVALTGGRRMAAGSLEAFSLSFLGHSPKDEISGKDVGRLVRELPESEWVPKIEAYVMNDVDHTSELEDVFLTQIDSRRKG